MSGSVLELRPGVSKDWVGLLSVDFRVSSKLNVKASPITTTRKKSTINGRNIGEVTFIDECKNG